MSPPSPSVILESIYAKTTGRGGAVLPNLGWVGPHPTFVGFEYDDRRRVPSVTRAVGPTRWPQGDSHATECRCPRHHSMRSMTSDPQTRVMVAPRFSAASALLHSRKSDETQTRRKTATLRTARSLV